MANFPVHPKRCFRAMHLEHPCFLNPGSINPKRLTRMPCPPVFKNPSELRVAVRDMLPAPVVRESRDDVSERRQRLIDLLALLQALTRRSGQSHALGSRQIHQVELADLFEVNSVGFKQGKEGALSRLRFRALFDGDEMAGAASSACCPCGAQGPNSRTQKQALQEAAKLLFSSRASHS